jgi:type III secretion protein U
MAEKTEQPTPKKLRDARKKGQVARSREISSAAGIVGLFGFIWLAWDFFLENLKELILFPTGFYEMPFRNALPHVLYGVMKKFILISLPVVLAALVVAIMANFMQIGVLFAFESIKPDIKKINPAQGIKKIFSLNNLIELLKSIVKIVFLATLLWIVIKGSIDSLLKIPHLGIPGVMTVLGAVMIKVVVFTSGAFVVVAVADFFFQKYQHIKKLKMTKDEVKREYKEMEGDPIIKGKRKQLHRELAMQDTVQKAKKATVIVTNPTRLAVALYYEKDKTPLPVVLTKGENLLAKRIIEVAREEGIPIMQNVPLAQDLYEHGDIDQYIPSELIEPVAEVLKWVQQLQRERE